MTSRERATGNLLTNLPDALDAEVTEVLAAAGGARVERITSHGQSAPPDGSWFDQDEDEFVAVLAGRARLTWGDGSRVDLAPGDWAWIPAHDRHRVEWTDPSCDTVWLAVFLPPRPS